MICRHLNLPVVGIPAEVTPTPGPSTTSTKATTSLSELCPDALGTQLAKRRHSVDSRRLQEILLGLCRSEMAAASPPLSSVE